MIKRKLYQDLLNHLLEKEITLLIGPRQTGKTTLLFLLREYLVKKGEKTIFFNLDIQGDQTFFSSQEKLISKIKIELGNNGYVFIDEIQRKENAGLFLKGIYDQNLPYKFIVTGSGSLELKEKIHESLAGRKRIFELPTVTFEEFCHFKTNYKYENENRLEQLFTLDPSLMEKLLNEYLNFGGYPKVILAENLEKKIQIIDEIYQSYLEKDIVYLLGIRKTDDFSNLAALLSHQIGQLTNISELSNTLNISHVTLKNYLWYLEKTFIINRVPPFFHNLRKEITKRPIFYFYDLGLRNQSLHVLGKLSNQFELGFVFQNFMYNIIKHELKQSSIKINFWRSTSNAEVDFIVNYGNRILPIEVKYKHIEKPIISRSLKSFIEAYKPTEVLIVNLNSKEFTLIENQTKIIWLPFYKITNYLLE